MTETQKTNKSYSDFLPPVLGAARSDFLKRFMSIFEKILSGIDDGVTIDGISSRDDISRDVAASDGVSSDDAISSGVQISSIAAMLDTISRYFYPLLETEDINTGAPVEFLEWLSSWVGLVLKEDWGESKKRKVLANIIPIYRMRGTKTGLEVFLNIYTDGGVKINDNLGLFQVEFSSAVGISTAFDLNNYFVIEVTLSDTERGLNAMERKKRIIETIVEREKPIHTRYKVRWSNVKSLQVELSSAVGIDTLLWSYNE